MTGESPHRDLRRHLCTTCFHGVSTGVMTEMWVDVEVVGQAFEGRGFAVVHLIPR